jgi:hypothetical protein
MTEFFTEGIFETRLKPSMIYSNKKKPSQKAGKYSKGRFKSDKAKPYGFIMPINEKKVNRRCLAGFLLRYVMGIGYHHDNWNQNKKV